MTKTKSTKKIDRLLIVTREYDGLAGAGGVKDVSAQLAGALARAGIKVSVVLPRYGFLEPHDLEFSRLGLSFEVPMFYAGRQRWERFSVWSRCQAVTVSRQRGSVTVYLIESQRFAEKRNVYTYTAAEEAEDPSRRRGEGHYDYFAMNVLLQKAAINLMMLLGERPDIIHCQDGHTALLPAMIREIEGYRAYFSRCGCLVTIHNAGRGYHQEVDDLPFAAAITGLPERVIHANLLEDKFDPLLTASSYAVMNTVSENYARELQQTQDDELTGWLGHLLRRRGVILQGVTNGINPLDYSPAKPERLGLAAAFDPEKDDFAGKQICRERLLHLLAENSLDGQMIPKVRQTGTLTPGRQEPLFTFVGRFTPQKGVDKLVEALEILLFQEGRFQILLMGNGDREIEKSLVGLAANTDYRGRICLLRGFDPILANQVYAAGDFFLIPSRYEPCGLTDFIAQLFGNIPIVHHVGGLVKVVEGKTGFVYRQHSSAALLSAIEAAITLYLQDPESLNTMQRQAVQHIKENYTWDLVLKKYNQLYQEGLAMTAAWLQDSSGQAESDNPF